MQPSRSPKVRWWWLRLASAVGLFLLLLLSADPGLHRCLHEDAGQSGHECALTLLAQGGLDVAPVALVPVPPSVVDIPVPEAPLRRGFGSGLRLPPGCGPPPAGCHRFGPGLAPT